MVELEFVHDPLMIMVSLVSLGVSIYCFQLLSKYFKGGIFEGSIKALGAFTVFFSIAILFDLIFLDWILEPIGLQLVDAHTYHMVLEIIFFLGLFYAIRKMCMVWRKMGSR